MSKGTFNMMVDRTGRDAAQYFMSLCETIRQTLR